MKLHIVSQKSDTPRVTGYFPGTDSSQQNDYSIERVRLSSLYYLPPSCKVFRVRLAYAGFYYDTSNTNRNANNIHETVCYSCGLTYAKWKEGDNPIVIHQELYPDCSHLKNLQTNVYRVVPSNLLSATNVSSKELKGMENTISNLEQKSVLPGHIGAAAMQSVDKSLETDSEPSLSCSHVPSSSSQFTASRASDTCYAAQQVTQQSGSVDWSSNFTSSVSTYAFDEKPALCIGYAVYPQFATIQSRLLTFSKWTRAVEFPPEVVAQYGFYYAGYADCLRCFYCGIGLKSWQEDDDVLQEHIRWRPQCGFLLATKGRHFINSTLARLKENVQKPSSQISNNDVQSKHGFGQSSNQHTIIGKAASTQFKRPSNQTHYSSDSPVPTGNKLATNAVMESILKQVLGMGFSEDSVERAVHALQESGSPVNANTLTDQLCEIQF